MVIEPNHQRLGVTGMLYSNLQGTRGAKRFLSDTLLWNYLHQRRCPVDIYAAQRAKRRGA